MQNLYAFALMIFGCAILLNEWKGYLEWQYFLHRADVVKGHVVDIKTVDHSAKRKKNIRDHGIYQYHYQGYPRKFMSKASAGIWNVQIGQHELIHVIKQYPNVARTNLEVALKPVQIIIFSSIAASCISWGCFVKFNWQAINWRYSTWQMEDYAYLYLVVVILMVFFVFTAYLYRYHWQFRDDPQRYYPDNARVISTPDPLFDRDQLN